MIYFIVIFFLFLLVYQYDILKKKAGFHFFLAISFITIVLIAGLRYKVGSDTFGYMNNYDYYPSFSEFSTFDFKGAPYEFLWYTFCAVCKLFSKSYFFMQFTHALLVNAVFFHFIHKYISYRFLGVLLYFIFGFLYFNTEIMREALAVSVFLLSLDAFYEKKWIRYYLFVIVAIFFHSSAFLLIFFPFFHKIKLNKIFIFSTLIILASAGVLWQIFNESVEHFVNILTIGNKANSYLDNDKYVYNLNGMIRSLFTYFLVPFIFAGFAFRNTKQNFKEIPFVWLYIIFGVFTIFNVVIFSRFQNYLFFPFIAFLANLCYEATESNKQKHIVLKNLRLVVLFLLLFIGRYYGFFKLDIYGDAYVYQRYFPYHSIITKKASPARRLLEQWGQ